MTVLTIFMFESQLMQMPGPRDIVIFMPAPGHFLLCKSPGTGHTFRCKSPRVTGGGGGGGDGNRSNWYVHNFHDRLMKGNYGFLVYICGNWHTLWPARNMTLQNEAVEKGKCFEQCQRKSFASFLLCHVLTLF